MHDLSSIGMSTLTVDSSVRDHDPKTENFATSIINKDITLHEVTYNGVWRLMGTMGYKCFVQDGKQGNSRGPIRRGKSGGLA